MKAQVGYGRTTSTSTSIGISITANAAYESKLAYDVQFSKQIVTEKITDHYFDSITGEDTYYTRTNTVTYQIPTDSWIYVYYK